MTAAAMKSVRINFHDEDKQGLLERFVVPEVRAAAEEPGITSVWPQTHWRFGPHITIFLDGTDDAVSAVARGIAHRAGIYLAQHPSTRVLDDAEWDQTSRALGRLELIEAPYLPLQPNNTAAVVDGAPEDTFLRTRRAILAKGSSSGAGLDALVGPDGSLLRGQAAVEATFRGMAAIAASYPQWGLVSGYQAFLSHWKEYFHWEDDEARLSGPLHQSWVAQQDRLCAVVEAARRRSVVTHDPESVGRPVADPVLEGWFGWVESQLPSAHALAKTGDVLPYPHPSRLVQAAKFGPDVEVQWSGSDERQYSDFHKAFRQLDFTRLGNGTDFAAYRFVINNFFDLLPFMGISPMQRYSLAYLLTEAAQQVVGETWDVTIGKAVARQQAQAPEAEPTLPWRGSHV